MFSPVASDRTAEVDGVVGRLTMNPGVFMVSNTSLVAELVVEGDGGRGELPFFAKETTLVIFEAIPASINSAPPYFLTKFRQGLVEEVVDDGLLPTSATSRPFPM